MDDDDNEEEKKKRKKKKPKPRWYKQDPDVHYSKPRHASDILIDVMKKLYS